MRHADGVAAARLRSVTLGALVARGHVVGGDAAMMVVVDDRGVVGLEGGEAGALGEPA